jgi:uncharacterized membrane protein YtjA (UPF0391 family)
MLRWAILFFIIALVAALIPGMAGLTSVAVNIGYFLAVVFLVLFVISLVVGRGAAPPV